MKTLIIDVREPEEFARGHVDGAINLPPADIMTGAPQLKDVPKDTPMILYCVSGSRSNASMNFLSSMGYTNLTNGINQSHVTQLLQKNG